SIGPASVAALRPQTIPRGHDASISERIRARPHRLVGRRSQGGARHLLPCPQRGALSPSAACSFPHCPVSTARLVAGSRRRGRHSHGPLPPRSRRSPPSCPARVTPAVH